MGGTVAQQQPHVKIPSGMKGCLPLTAVFIVSECLSFYGRGETVVPEIQRELPRTLAAIM